MAAGPTEGSQQHRLNQSGTQDFDWVGDEKIRVGWVGWSIKVNIAFLGFSSIQKVVFVPKKLTFSQKSCIFTEKVVLFTKKLKKVGKSLNSCTTFSNCIHTVVLQVVQLKERHKVKRKGK